MEYSGRPKFFDVDHYLDSVEQMIMADEICFALKMLENLPGYYRDNVPQRALDIKKLVLKNTMTVIDYSNDFEETVQGIEAYAKESFADIVNRHSNSIKGWALNQVIAAIGEHRFRVSELGPAYFWVPEQLVSVPNAHYDFQSLQKQASSEAVNRLKDIRSNFLCDSPMPGAKEVFVCFETIEHMWNEDDVFHYYTKFGIEADYVVMSCPLYTLTEGLEDWKTRTLGHVRTYTPRDLSNFIKKHWPGYTVETYATDSIVCIASKTKA
jgi:hypothetical protein